MALDYFAPGVYVEEVDRGSRPIEGISLSVAGFIGFTEDVRGDAELFKPMMVTNFDQYREYFAKPGSDGFTDENFYLPFAVQGWFLNGGGRCWVTSIGTKPPGANPPPPSEIALKMTTSSGKSSLSFNIKETDASESALALPSNSDRLKGVIQESTPKPLPEDVDENTESPINTGEFFDVLVVRGGEVLERFPHLTQQ